VAYGVIETQEPKARMEVRHLQVDVPDVDARV
jgi:hypothetical protein